MQNGLKNYDWKKVPVACEAKGRYSSKVKERRSLQVNPDIRNKKKAGKEKRGEH